MGLCNPLMSIGPSYVAAQSADVILSDVRPIRLKVEALKAINALLDEFLFNILKSANSLSTDRLKASLLELLPTSLGKEALLEAEVELRAYYERIGTGAVSSLSDDSKTFNFQFAFEVRCSVVISCSLKPTTMLRPPVAKIEMRSLLYAQRFGRGSKCRGIYRGENEGCWRCAFHGCSNCTCSFVPDGNCGVSAYHSRLSRNASHLIETNLQSHVRVCG